MSNIDLELANLRVNKIFVTETKRKKLMRLDSFSNFLHLCKLAVTVFNLVRLLINVVKFLIEKLTSHRQGLITSEKLRAFENCIAQKENGDEECAKCSKLRPELLMALIGERDSFAVHVEGEAFVTHSVNRHHIFLPF